MIKEDYCSYKTSVLLKDKGFNENTTHVIYRCSNKTITDNKTKPIKNSELSLNSKAVSCPTHQMAIAWLRQKHNIHIYATFSAVTDKWVGHICKIGQGIWNTNIYLSFAYKSYNKTIDLTIRDALYEYI